MRATRSRTLNFLITYAESDASLSLWPCCIYLFTQKVSSTKYFRCAHLFRPQWIYARECDTRLSFGHPSIRESYATAWCLFLRGERVSNIILICAVMTQQRDRPVTDSTPGKIWIYEMHTSWESLSPLFIRVFASTHLAYKSVALTLCWHFFCIHGSLIVFKRVCELQPRSLNLSSTPKE